MAACLDRNMFKLWVLFLSQERAYTLCCPGLQHLKFGCWLEALSSQCRLRFSQPYTMNIGRVRDLHMKSPAASTRPGLPRQDLMGVVLQKGSYMEPNLVLHSSSLMHVRFTGKDYRQESH